MAGQIVVMLGGTVFGESCKLLTLHSFMLSSMTSQMGPASPLGSGIRAGESARIFSRASRTMHGEALPLRHGDKFGFFPQLKRV